MVTDWYIVAFPPADSRPALTDSATYGKKTDDRKHICHVDPRDSSRLTTSDMAVHGVDYDCSFPRLRALADGDLGVVAGGFGSGFGSGFCGGFNRGLASSLLGRRRGLRNGCLGFVLFRKVVLQPLGRETHRGLVEGRGEEKGGLCWGVFVSLNLYQPNFFEYTGNGWETLDGIGGISNVNKRGDWSVA